MAEKIKLNLTNIQELGLLVDLIEDRQEVAELGDEVIVASRCRDLMTTGTVVNYPPTYKSSPLLTIKAEDGETMFRHRRIVMTLKEYNETIERDYPEYLI